MRTLLIIPFLMHSCLGQNDRKMMNKADVEKIAFVGGNIIPMSNNTDSILHNYTILVDDGCIVQIGKTSELIVPDGYIHFDVSDKYVLPGFIDMHVHLSDDGDMVKFVKHGVTTIRNMSDIPWWTRAMGFSNILKLRQKQRARKIVGPDIYTCGYTLDGNPPVSPMNKRILNNRDAKKEISREKQNGYDAIKLYDNLTFEAYKAIVDVAKELDMPVAGHVPHAVPLDVILNDKVVSIEHLTGYINNKTADYSIPEDSIDNYLELNRKQGIYNVPTLAVWACMPPENGIESLKDNPKYKALSWHIRWMWKTALPYYYDISYPDKTNYTKHMLELTSNLTNRLYKAGCPLLIGTDSNIAGTYVGEATLLEMELFVKAGIPIYETLRSATILPARALGKESEIGSIETGKKANLTILSKNPLEDIASIRKIEWVYCNCFLIKGDEAK